MAPGRSAALVIEQMKKTSNCHHPRVTNNDNGVEETAGEKTVVIKVWKQSGASRKAQRGNPSR